MEEEIEHIEKPIEKKKSKWLRRLTYTILSIFILFDVFLFFFATPVLKDYMQEKVKAKTHGLYQINFDKISIEIGSRRISLKNFKLIPDTIVYNELLKTGKAKSAIYQISTSSIELWGTGFYKLFFQRHFKAKELLIKNPVVVLKKLPSLNKKPHENRDFIHEDLFPSIEKYIDQIELSKIMLENGKFHLNLNKNNDRNTTHYGFVTIGLIQFLLNKEEFEQKARLFYANDVQISIDDYRLKLGDDRHFLYADSIIISTKESLLKVKSVEIKPKIELQQYLTQLKNNYYYISTPEIKFKNFNISNLYFNQDIEIQNIIIESPQIKLIDKHKKKVSLKKESKEIDFYKLIKSKLKSISINTMDLSNANFKFYRNSHLEAPIYEIKNYNLNLFGFFLDKHSKDDQSRILYSKNIRLNIDKFSAIIKDNTHLITTGKINLHTDTKSLYVENISLHPLKTSAKQLNIKLSNIDIKGADFHKLYHKKTLTINYLSAGRSKTNINLLKNDNATKKKQSTVISDFSEKLIKNLYIRNIRLKKANFKISTYQEDSLLNKLEGEINLNLKRFNLANTDKLFYSDKFKIELFNYSQFLKDHLHILKVDEVYMSNTDSLVSFSKLSIKPKIESHQKLSDYNKSKLINFQIESSSIKGIDIPKAYENKDLTIKTILITKPSLEISDFINIQTTKDTSSVVELNKDTLEIDSLVYKNTITSLLSAYFEKIQIADFSLKKGGFRFMDIDSLNRKNLIMSGKLSATVKDFDYDYKTNIEHYGFANSKDFNFELDDFYRKISENKYQLKIKKAKLSSKDSIFSAEIIRLFPSPNVHDSLYSDLIWTIYSPKLESKGINITALLNENVLDLGLIKLTRPSIALVKQKDKNNAAQKTEEIKTNQKNFPFEKIITDSIIIVDGAFGILKDKFDLKNQIFNMKLNIQLSGFQIDSNSIKNPLETIKQINTVVQLQDFHYLLAKNNYLLDIENFHLNSENETVQIDNINYYNPQGNITEGEKETLEALHIPSVNFKAFSYEDLIDTKLVSDSIFISKPDIRLTLSQSNGTLNKNPLEINFYQKIKNITKGIKLSHIQIDDAAFRIKNTKGDSTNISSYNKIHGTISNLLIDSMHQGNKNQLFNTSDIAFRLNDYELETKNKFYKIKINELGFSTGLKKVYANLISMSPSIERDALAASATTEVKLIYFDINKFVVNKFDFRDFLVNKRLIAEQISISDFKLHSYKNKHFPMDSVIKIALPLDYILNAENYIKVDTIKIDNSYIGVELLGANSTESGYFDITRLNATFTGVSNDKELIKEGLTLKANASGYIMDEGLLTASFRFPLNSEHGEYFYGGKLSRMNMTAFNPLLENLFFVSIRDGVIDSLNFNISANDDYSEGKMKFRYNNLKFDIENKKKSDSLIVSKRGLASLAANSIVKDNNPRRKGGHLKEGRVYYERDVYYPIFQYWTMSTVSGVQSTMGFKSKQLKERIKLEKLTEKLNRTSAKKKSKIKRKEKKKYQKEIDNELIKEGNSH